MSVDIAQSAAVPLDAGDRDHVEHLVRRSGTSFFWAMRFLPPEKRNAMFAVYAFCRIVDDIADDPGDEDEKRRQLAEWREEIDRLYAGEPGLPISRALAEPVDRFGLRRTDFLAIIDGMEMDAAERLRIADLKLLSVYCDRVASAVGRLSVRIFGLPEDLGDRLAGALGQALQLTNILRDISEDARRDRLYLPGDLLRSRGVGAQGDADDVLRHPAIAEVCEQLAQMARRCFDEAAAIAARCDRRRVRPAVMMMQVYRRTFDRLVERGWQRWAEPVTVSPAEKLWVAFRYGML